jgi:hypothetical protein
MSIAIKHSPEALRIGRRKFKLLTDKRDLCDYVCECNSKVNFSELRDFTGTQLPDRVRIQLSADDREYEYAWYINVTRHGDRVRLGLACSYGFHEWREPVHLQDFYARFVALLSRSRKLSLDAEADFEGNEIYVTASMDIPASSPLRAGYDELVHLLLSTHAEAKDDLTRVLRATVMSDGGTLSGAARAVSRREKPVAFICHDSRDKEKTARPIADGLSALRCPVWYDEFSMRVGDRLRESIERGLKEARKCILIVSPRFLSNDGWTKVEFNSIFTRELVERRDILLPVWIGVKKEDVLKYSPCLANRLAVNWNVGLEEVVRQLYVALQGRRFRT